MPVIPFIPAMITIASKVGTQKLVDPAGVLPKGVAKVLNKGADPAGIFMKPEAGAAGAGSAPTALAVDKPTVMPTPDDKTVQDAKKKSIIEQLSNRGRASTILTDQTNDQKLGG
jgi:hypothetical protein